MEALLPSTQNRKKKALTPSQSHEASAMPPPVATPSSDVLDVRSLACPGPVVRLKERMDSLQPGEGIRLLAPLTFEPDLESWSQGHGHAISNLTHRENWLEATITKGQAPLPAPQGPQSLTQHGVAIVLFSNDLDKVLAALILANGLAASGAKVGIFFTFWGLSVLRKHPGPLVHKGLVSRLFGWMLPKGATRLALSKMNMLGMGTAMMKRVMASKHVLTVPELLESARKAGVTFIACDMAMDVMGLSRDELIEVDQVAGVASFARLASQSNNTLFI